MLPVSGAGATHRTGSIFDHQIVARMHTPRLAVLANQADEGVDLSGRDVLLQQLSVVVEQSCDCVLGQHVIADLLLHEAELFGYIFLAETEKYRIESKMTGASEGKRTYASDSAACFASILLDLWE